jgi:hypothetical protein
MHAHPGRCFLAGLDDGDPLVGMLGAAEVAVALVAAEAAGLTAVTLSTVADLRVLAPDPVRGLRAARQFQPGEAYADHRRQLDEISRVVAASGAQVAVTAADIVSAQADGRTAVPISGEGGDFLEGQTARLAEARGLARHR